VKPPYPVEITRSNPYLSVIIPAHNEAHRLPACLDQTINYLFRSPYNYEVIVVENGSTDETWKVCEKYRATYGHFFPQRLAERGKGAAVRAGMLAACGRYRLYMDADLSTPLTEIAHALDHIRSHDIVIGSRELKESKVKAAILRRVMGRVFHSLIVDLVPDIHDTQCGFKMFRDWTARDLFQRQKVDGMAFDVELLWLAHLYGYSVHEMPVQWTHDSDSRVRLVSDSLSMLWDVVNIPMKHIKQKLPA
jgi:dolichyl-phosphate beta-glucosyltransferase